MGKKTNNMPVRKKKIKDKNNFQIQGKAGRGRKREKGRAERIREMNKTGGIKGVVVEEKKPTQVNWVELAKQQEQRAVAEVQPQEADPAAKLSKKARKKQRMREEQEQAQPKGMERSHHPKEGIRSSTVQFGEDGDDAGFAPAAAEGR